MADWFRYNVNNQQDADLLYLLRVNGGFTFWFEGLICVAKAVADEDPERWHGHLVTPAGNPLTEEDFARILPQYSRKHRELVTNFLRTCRERALITHEPDTNVLRINNFGRWWRAPEKRGKASSGEGLPKVSEQKKTPAAKTDFPQADALQTDKQTDRQIPPNPQGGPAAGPGGPSSMLNHYRSLDPDTVGDVIDDIPEDTSKDDLPASDDKGKLSGHLTRKQFSILRGRADQLLQQLSPGGLARGQQMALWGYLDTPPPPGWPDPPERWAEFLCHWIKASVSEVQKTIAERKDHGIGNPTAVAIGRAKTFAAEKIAEARAAKRG